MKILVTILLTFLLSQCSTGVSPDMIAAKKKPLPSKDTIFLERNVCERFSMDSFTHFYHAIYIERNRNSTYYDQISNFNFTASENLEGFHTELKKRGIALSKVNNTDLPAEWVPLYQYKNKYYVYYPSEQGLLNRRILNDSLLICWYLDGPYPYVLSSVKKTGNNKYSIQTKDYFNNPDVFAKPELLNIYIIDEKNKIAVWEYKTNKDPHYFYRLFVAKENIRNFDLVVNYCLTDKMREFNFDEPDFTTLLKKKVTK